MSPDNFLLGYGERLTSPITPPPSMMEKHSPYTFDESVARLTPELQSTATKLAELPGSARPNGKTVAAITLHPSYTAKSYYPSALFDALNVEPIGSKESTIKPQKWTRKGEPETVRTTTIFVQGDLTTFEELPTKIAALSPSSPAGKDVVKIEQVKSISEVDRVKNVDATTTDKELEVVLHIGDTNASSYILNGFKSYVEELELDVDLDKRLQMDGLCFVAVKAPGSKAQELAKFSYLRAVREMPHMRPILRNTPGLSFDALLPEGAPVDPGIRVAVFDGGIPDSTAIEPWVRRHEVEGIGSATQDGQMHGTAVTGALLLGPLQSGTAPQQPYCYVDHYRVLDGEGEDDELTVITRIKNVIESTNYSYVNLSLGPEMPIEDDDVSPWTTILDKLFLQKNILATIATGNWGEQDEASGNARIQPPSDAVNGLAVGASDRTTDGWSRASYSSYGPGRAPGIIKPDILAFGGSPHEPFHLIDAFNQNTTCQATGTSFAAPLALRTALGVRAYFGDVLSPIALKALLVHSAKSDDTHERKHCGWGRIPLDFQEIVATNGDAVRIVYQGSLSPAEWVNVPIPMPSEQLNGMVTISATLCYFTDTDPEDPVNYTKAGMEIRFRPHSDKRKNVEQLYPDSKSFFQKAQYNLFDDDLNYNAHFWETTLSASKKMRATSLNEPVFNLHYNARDGGARAGDSAAPINYAMIITISAPRHSDLYQKTSNRYRTQLEALQPVVQIPITVSS
jgi:hypothetical protein